MRARDAAISAAWCSIWRRRASSSSAWLTRAQAQGRLAAEGAEQLAVVGVQRAAALRPALEQPELLAALDEGEARRCAGRVSSAPTPAAATTGTTPVVDARAQRSRSARRAVATSSSRTSERPACSAGGPNVSISRASLPTSPKTHRSATRSNQSRTGKQQGGDRQHRRRHRCARHDVRGRRVGGEPGQPTRRAEDGHEADADRHLAHGDGGVAELRLDDGRRRTGGHRRPGHRPGQGDEEPVAELDEAEQADELDHGDDSHPGHQAQRQPAQLPPLVDARSEQRPGEQSGGDERAEGKDEEHRLAARLEEA